jgi:hypothetical protein
MCKNIFFEFIMVIQYFFVPSPGLEPGTFGSKPNMISSFTTRADNC